MPNNNAIYESSIVLAASISLVFSYSSISYITIVFVNSVLR